MSPGAREDLPTDISAVVCQGCGGDGIPLGVEDCGTCAGAGVVADAMCLDCHGYGDRETTTPCGGCGGAGVSELLRRRDRGAAALAAAAVLRPDDLPGPADLDAAIWAVVAAACRDETYGPDLREDLAARALGLVIADERAQTPFRSGYRELYRRALAIVARLEDPSSD